MIGSSIGAPTATESGMTPAQHGHAASSSSSSGPPVRTFAEASSIEIERTVVAMSSFSFGGRASRERPRATCSTMASSAANFSSRSATIVAFPNTTTER